MIVRLLLSLVLMLSAVAMPSPAHAWSAEVHRIIAELAQRHLTPAAKAEALRLLAVDGAHSLADVATWADELRDARPQTPLGKATSPLHYIKFGDERCRFDVDPAPDCKDGQCIVGAIERYTAIVTDRSRSDAERAEALRFVIHFVGDVHQPLHNGYRDDRGGNRYQVQFDGNGKNLHDIWDDHLVGGRGLSLHDEAEALAKEAHPVTASGDAKDWSACSCRLTRGGGVYPAGHRIDAAYIAKLAPLARRQVRLAAANLAALINRSLS